jgi:tetratricopeptide (TPR) repeat protein
MKQSYVVTGFILILLSALFLTGFQCGSAEATSAKLYMQRGDWPAAEKAWQKEVDKNDQNTEAWYSLGEVRARMRNYPGMLQAFEKAWNGPGGEVWHQRIADVKKGAWGTNLNEGVIAFNAGAKASPDSAAVYREKAVESYKTALLINPDSAITYLNIAIALQTLGRVDEQIAYLEKGLAVKKDPQFINTLINAYLTKAAEARKAGKTEEAKTYYMKAVDAVTSVRESGGDSDEMRQVEGSVHLQLGVIALQADNLTDATLHLDKAIELDSSSQDGLYNGGLAYLKVAAKMKEASAGDPKKLDPTYVSRLKRAAALLDKYLAAKPDDGATWELLGTAYGMAGMTKEAAVAMRRADALKKK